jgi:hypothetical protein
MKKLLFIAVILLLGLSNCKKDETVTPTPEPSIVEGYGKLTVNTTNMNIKSVDLTSGYDVYKFTTNTYGGVQGAYHCTFSGIKNKTYDYSISYLDNNKLSKGIITIIKDETVIIHGL